MTCQRSQGSEFASSLSSDLAVQTSQMTFAGVVLLQKQ